MKNKNRHVTALVNENVYKKFAVKSVETGIKRATLASIGVYKMLAMSDEELRKMADLIERRDKLNEE